MSSELVRLQLADLKLGTPVSLEVMELPLPLNV